MAHTAAPISSHDPREENLARRSRGNVLALLLVLATGHIDVLPGPVGAATITAQDVDRLGIALHRASDAIQSDILDGDAVRWLTSGATVLVVLFNDHAIIGDARQLDVGVGNVLDITARLVDGLDAHTVGRVHDLTILDMDILDGVVRAATDRADGQTVTTGAVSVGEVDGLPIISIFPTSTAQVEIITHLTRVDSQAIILVVHLGTVDVDASAVTDVKAISVVAALAITQLVVNGDISQVHVGALHTDGLDRRVLDVQTRDIRVLDVVHIHELGLLLAAVRALAVPPALTLAVKHGAGGLGECHALTAETDEGAAPFLVAEGGGALEGDLYRAGLDERL